MTTETTNMDTTNKLKEEIANLAQNFSKSFAYVGGTGNGDNMREKFVRDIINANTALITAQVRAARIDELEHMFGLSPAAIANRYQNRLKELKGDA